MYKDIWKRIGTKVLIVLCSVLLVGGVAVAVPVLRAAPSQPISLGSVYSASAKDDNGEWLSGYQGPKVPVPASGAALVVTNPKVDYAVSAGTVNTAEPILEVQFNGDPNDKWTLAKNEYALTVDGKSGSAGQAELLKAGNHIVYMRPGIDKNRISEDGTQSAFRFLVNQIAAPGGSGNVDVWSELINNNSGYLNTTNIKASVDEVDVDSDDYVITGEEVSSFADAKDNPNKYSAATEAPAGDHTFWITFRNYTVDGATSVQKTISIRKDISCLAASLSYDRVNKKVTGTITDKTYTLREGRDYDLKYNYVEGASTVDVTITAKTGRPYDGNTVVHAPVVETPQTLSGVTWNANALKGIDGIAATIDYDKDKDKIESGYEIKKSEITNLVVDGQSYNGDFSVLGVEIVDKEGEDAKPLAGRTAGIARMMLQFSGNRIGYIYYNVRRNIENETLQLSATPEGNLTYKPQGENYKTPVIIFNNADPVTITNNDSDFRVHYWLSRGDLDTGINKPQADTSEDVSYEERAKAQKYAGTVYMDIYTKTGDTAPGYYGSITKQLTYTVAPVQIDQMSLQQTEISQTTKRENFERNIVRLHPSSFDADKFLDILSEREKGTTVSFSYRNTDTNRAVSGNWNTLPAGHYTVQCNVSGNYSSAGTTLSTAFTVKQYDGIQADIANSCKTGDPANNHEWNENAHEPKVTLTAPNAGENGESIDLEEGENGAYIVRYHNNTAVGDAVAEVYYTTDLSKKVFELTFKIAPRSILTESGNNWAPQLYFRAETGFSVTNDGSYKNEFVYGGKNARPALEKLRYKIQYDGKDLWLDMQKGTDYTVDADDDGISKLYRKNGREVDLTEEGINSQDEYYFKIFPTGNFRAGSNGFADYVLAGPFKFVARDLSKDGIGYTLDAYSYSNWNDNQDTIKDWIKNNIIVTDNGVTPSQNLSEDEFSIEVTKDKRDEDGTIEFNIVGTAGSLYTGKKPGVLNVGRNIADASVVEWTADREYDNLFKKNELTQKYELTLTRTDYASTGTGDDPYALNFGGTAASGKNNTNLYYGNQILRAADDGADLKEYTYGRQIGPDYNNNGLVRVELKGVNGYYGVVTIYFKAAVIRINSTNFEIEFPTDANAPRYIYDGLPKEPSKTSFTLWDKREDKSADKSNRGDWKRVDSANYRIIGYDKNTNANEQYGESQQAKLDHWAIVEIEGINGYEGTLTGYFKIERRNISGINANDGKNNWNLNTDYFSFSQNTATDVLQPVDYIPKSVFPDGSTSGNGGWSDIKLYYSRTGSFGPSVSPLRWDEDYIYYCTGGGGADKKEPPTKDKINQNDPVIDEALVNAANAGTAFAVVKGKGNFKGAVIREYAVKEVDFNSETDDSTFTVAIGSEWHPFTGMDVEPAIDIVQERKGTITTLVKDQDYKVTYGPNVDKIFISRNYDNANNQTYMLIDGIGNYSGQLKQRYVIFGQLTDQNTVPNQIDPSSNSKLDYAVTPETGTRRIRYNADASILYSYANLGLHFLQRKDGGNFGATDENGIKRSDDYQMNLVVSSVSPGSPQIRGDYTVDDGSLSEIGKGYIRITGNCERGKTGIIEGKANIKATIWEDLSTVDGKSMELWREKNYGSNNITVTGSAITKDALKTALARALTINCGGRELIYEEDYVFDGNYLDTSIGLGKTARIVPSQKAGRNGEWYLDGYASIEYNLTADISGAKINNPIEGTYVYNHGSPLVKATDNLRVEINGNTLNNPRDYTIVIENQETGEIVDAAVNCGKYSYTVQGAGNYGGTLQQGEFEITRYSLSANADKITVKLKQPSVTFTGTEVLPEVEDVLIRTGNTEKSLADPNFNNGYNYYVTAGSEGSNVHWTDVANNEKRPVVEIHGDGNYEGVVTKDYLILKKNITNATDILITAIQNQIYNNNIPIEPKPQIRYVKSGTESSDSPEVLLNLNGILHDVSEDYTQWKDYNIHFTYQYLDDVRTAGKKRIHIMGIGDFEGEAEISYIVEPLKLADTKLTFLSEELPVYDGTPQTPAFKLSYGNVDSILIYRNGRVVPTEYLSDSDVDVVFRDNTDATTEEKKAIVSITIRDNSEAAKNYTGNLTRDFTILPAPLENHVRFMYRPKDTGGDVDLRSYKLSFPFVGEGSPVYPKYALADAELAEDEIGMYYNYPQKANHGNFLVPGTDIGSQEDPDGFSIEYKYVEPDTDDTDIREEYQRDVPDYAGKVRVTITGKRNYTGKATFWYFIGDDISSDAKISMTPKTAVFNSQNQYPTVTITGVDKNKCTIGNYRGEVSVENLITDKDFINAGTYYIRVEGDPSKGTYATKPETLEFTITPRAFSNSLVIDGFKKEYSYTGYEIRPVGISVTDYIDNIKYRLTEDDDYVLTYSNNLNAGIAYINIKGQNNFSGTASTSFLITSSTISSGGNGSNSFLDQGSGEISGAVPVSPGNVTLTMDTSDAMYYTGKAVYPKVSIAGMTENVDYTVTFSNNVEVGTGVATITGIGNNNGAITKNFRIVAPLSKCTISPIPAQQYTGSAVTPSLTVRCGNTVLMEGTDYTVTYSNNINIGTATATIRALNNANFTGTASVNFSIGNDVGGFIISGYAPSYAYTGNAITPGVVVETGSTTLTLGTDYTVSYANNVNAGTATITVTGTGKYSGTQTANFIIEAKDIQSCDTTEVTDRTYTGDAYTPDITVSDGSKVLTKGVDYTVTYMNNTNPGTATIMIQGTSNNYTGTKVISFKIAAVAVKGLKASSVKYNSLKLKWTKQAYADGYQVCDTNSKVVKTVSTNAASITGLSAGKTYKYKVRSYVKNADGTRSYGAFSSVISTTTKLRTPAVKVVSTAKGQARISWSKVSGASGYEIYYKKSASAKYKKLKTVNNPKIRVCNVRGMKSGDRAYFRVRAFRKNGSKNVYSALNPLKVITVK